MNALEDPHKLSRIRRPRLSSPGRGLRGVAPKYKTGEKIMNRSFLSTSKDRRVAENFLNNRVIVDKIAVLCIYMIKDKRAALDIHSISQFPDEQEVLIVPWMAFVVKRKEHNNLMEIDLEQCSIENDT